MLPGTCWFNYWAHRLVWIFLVDICVRCHQVIIEQKTCTCTYMCGDSYMLHIGIRLWCNKEMPHPRVDTVTSVYRWEPHPGSTYTINRNLITGGTSWHLHMHIRSVTWNGFESSQSHCQNTVTAHYSRSQHWTGLYWYVTFIIWAVIALSFATITNISRAH